MPVRGGEQGELQDGVGSRRALQAKRVRRDGWTKQRREQFLAALANSCNVLLSAQVAGMSQRGVYDLRRRDPAFAQSWQEALALGYERLEAALLAHALKGLNAIDIAELAPPALPDAALPVACEAATLVADGGLADREVSRNALEFAMLLLKHHRPARDGGYRGKIEVATEGQTDQVLLKALDRIDRQRARQEGRTAEQGR